MPADFSCGTASGAGVSIRSTWPGEQRVGARQRFRHRDQDSLSVFGIRFLFQ
jgi:hypothetical protein